MERHYCWRCQIEMPMLDEAEWGQLAPLLTDMGERIKGYRERTGESVEVARRLGFERPALDKYFELTGFRETNINALWHHQLSLHGRPCRHCGRLLRTKVARRCVECGADVAQSMKEIEEGPSE